MLNKLCPKARYVWQQATTRTASENKDKLQNILNQRVIVTKHCKYLAGKDIQLAKGFVKHNVQTSEKAQNITQRLLGKGMKDKDNLLVYSLGYPKCQTVTPTGLEPRTTQFLNEHSTNNNNTSMKTVV